MSVMEWTVKEIEKDSVYNEVLAVKMVYGDSIWYGTVTKVIV